MGWTGQGNHLQGTVAGTWLVQDRPVTTSLGCVCFGVPRQVKGTIYKGRWRERGKCGHGVTWHGVTGLHEGTIYKGRLRWDMVRQVMSGQFTVSLVRTGRD